MAATAFRANFPISSRVYVLYNKSLSPIAKVMYQMIVDRQRSELGEYTISNADFCNMLGVTKPTAIRAKRELIKARVLKEKVNLTEKGWNERNSFEVVDREVAGTDQLLELCDDETKQALFDAIKEGSKEDWNTLFFFASELQHGQEKEVEGYLELIKSKNEDKEVQ